MAAVTGFLLNAGTAAAARRGPSDRPHAAAGGVQALIPGIATLLAPSRNSGVNLAPLLASAGIAGVAIGFGARTLVTDFLSGMFMILEDQYGVGDLVDAGPGVRHGHRSRPADHQAAGHGRHRLVHPQRRDQTLSATTARAGAPRRSTCRSATARTSTRYAS
ncbi:mechanosensitive ion channel family protein [Yinghuangia aomiensis]